MIVQLKDVFTPGGQPSVTYVGRENLDLEGRLRKAIKQGYALNVVTGPTKSGKTVLCRHVLSTGEPFIAVEGGQIRSEADFWEHVAYHLNIASTAQKTNNYTKSTQNSGEISGGLPAVLGGKINSSNSEQQITGTTATYQNIPMLSSIETLISKSYSVLVDDFHYIPSDVQKSIIQSLKAPIYKGLSVIFLAVPHRAFDPITVEDEMQGRFRHISIPPWTQEDLALIPQKGFDALNVKCEDGIIDRICFEGFSNPLLVQEICSELCAAAQIFERQESITCLPSNLFEETLNAVAKSKGFPKYRKLKEGPQARADRQQRKLRDGGTADIYEALMLALARLGPKARTQYDELRASLRELIDEGGQLPQKHEVTSALSHMSRIAKEKIEGEPPLEFLKNEDALVITDPFLLFYMRWQKDKAAPGSR